MTINEYLNGVPKMKSADGTALKDTMADIVEIWSNDACKGYCIEAMKAADFTREQIQAVLSEMQAVFGEKTVTEAERLYINF